jgi:hypothetical protein
MTSQEYIKQELNDFIVQFPQTRVHYEYDALSDVHFIEVVPNNVYHLDDAYIAWETEMYDKFVTHYPDQNICFISDDAVVSLENVQLELIGSVFESISSITTNEIVVEESIIKVTEFVNSDVFIIFTSNTNLFVPVLCAEEVILQNNSYSLAA